MTLSPTTLHRHTATRSAPSSSPFYAVAGTASAAEPGSMVISSIAGAVDAIFGTIGTAIQGKTQKDLMRQNGNQQLLQNAMSLHQQRLAQQQPNTKGKNYSSSLILGLVALFVFIILFFIFKQS